MTLEAIGLLTFCTFAAMMAAEIIYRVFNRRSRNSGATPSDEPSRGEQAEA